MDIETTRVPGEELIRTAVARLGALAPPPVLTNFAARVKEVLLGGSSSRGGSSLLSELLRGENRLLHFQAEINPFLRLAGLGWPDSATGSDRLLAEQAAECSALERELAREAGTPAAGLEGPESVAQFARDLHWRLTAQWPTESFDGERVADWVLTTLMQLQKDFGWQENEIRDPALFHALFLVPVRAAHPAVNPYYYDLDEGLIRSFHADVPVPEGPPPCPVLIEEPPFVTIRPWRRAGSSGIGERPLVIKTPSNAYRLPFWRRLFCNARFRLLHLVRNPAAAVNSLVAGWLHRGFHAHYVPGRLRIAGYSDRGRTGENDWWKFDLPPGWEEWTSRPLEEVCAFQWRAAHEAILDFASGDRVDYFRLRFEDLMGPPVQRRQTLERLGEWLGFDFAAGAALRLEALPPVMATGRPRPKRWLERAGCVLPAIADPQIQRVRDEIGYESDPSTWS
jgi:hypothetical protein